MNKGANRVGSWFPGKRARISVALSAVLLVLVLIPVVDELAFRYAWARTALEDVEVRYARLLGLLDAEQQIDETLALTGDAINHFAYAADDSVARVGADLQQRVRRVAEIDGLSVVGSQIMPARAGAGFEVVPLGLTLDANVGALRDFLLGLALEQPTIQIDSMIITVPRQRGVATDGRIRVQLQANAIHLLP